METRLVEINLISAQGLKPPPGSRTFQAYAVAWIDPAGKLRTAVDHGGENPTWNEKFVFRVPASLLSSDSASALSVEIYVSGGWYLPDCLVGSVRLLLSNLGLLGLPADSPAFTAVGLRRPSGRIHGILNVGAALLSRVPLFVKEALQETPAVSYRDFIGHASVLKDCNRDLNPVNGLCGLRLPRKIHASPSDQNLPIRENPL